MRRHPTIKETLKSLNSRYKVDDDARYYAIFFIEGPGPLTAVSEAGEEAETMAFDVIGPVDIDPSVEIINFIDNHGGAAHVVHKLFGRPKDVFVNPSLEHWINQKLGG